MNNKIHCALILAAGFGTRLKPITNSTPKCLVQVAGFPIMEYAINRMHKLLQLNLITDGKIHINTHYLASQVFNFVERHNMHDSIVLLHENKILDTGGAIKNLCAHKKQNNLNVLVQNVDSLFYGRGFIENFARSYKGQEFYIAIVPKNTLELELPGDFNIDESGKLVFKKGGEYTYTGLAIYNSKNFVLYKNNVFSIANLLRDKNFEISYYILPQNSKWVSVETPEILEYINKVYQKSISNENKNAL